jgi:Ser/Thr protein kinase RdoA (MazF antagonist)
MFYWATRYLREAGWSDWDVLQLNGRVWLIFRPGEKAPAVVGKSSTTPALRETALRECNALQRLAPYSQELSVPRLLFQADTPGGFIHLQTALPGKPLRRELSPGDGNRIAAQFDRIEGWLAKLQALAPSEASLAAVLRQRIFAATPACVPQVLLDAAAGSLPLFTAVPAVAVHGDFFGGNVLVADSRVSVIDWDTFHYGAPLEDLFSFATGAVFRYQEIELSAKLIWDAFWGSAPLATRTRAAALGTLARVGLPAERLRPLYWMYLVDRLTREGYLDTAAWRIFAARYIAAGMPAPWHKRG